jgi:anti-sigma regulatory factor (Ser/Thr protein kinase)
MPKASTKPPLVWSRAFPATPEHVRAVRASLRELLNGCPVTDDVLLCGSELATNAIQHSRSARTGGRFTVRAEVHPQDYILIEVEDGGGPWAEPAGDPGRGRGLDIIGALAASWGIKGDDRGRVVWARLDWPATGPARPPAGDCR